MKRILLLLLTAISFSSSGQGTRGAIVVATKAESALGRTYAVIIGISNYQNISKLQYADRDAKAFYLFLTSRSGGSVDSANIKFLVNQQAKRENMIRAISKWLMEDKKPKKGDIVYIYFAGHGDALPGIDSWLLGWDVPNSGDPNVDYDQSGGIQIGLLKRRIRLLADSGAKVILITDACRGNELLSGGEKGRDYVSNELLANDMEMKIGGLQFASCSTGEVSREDKSWGGGRGLFSYWFINGLYGMADKDSDGYVTAGELREYVANNVKAATGRKDATGKRIYDQNPFYCCSENDNEVIATVDPVKKQEIAEMIKRNEDEEGLLASIGNRGLNGVMSKLTDTVKSLYDRFETQIQEDTSVEYDWKKYLITYNYIYNQPLPEELKANIKEDLVIALFNHSQQAMNIYLEHGKNQTQNFWKASFSNSVCCIDTALKLINKNDELYAKIKRNSLILEAAYYTHIDAPRNKKLMLIALRDLDSARSFNQKPSAVVSHLYGQVYFYLGKDSEAIKNELEAHCIAPAWFFPINSLGVCYMNLNQLNKAEEYQLQVLKMDSNYIDGWNNLGNDYLFQKQYDQALKYYLKALQIDSTRFDIVGNIGEMYFNEGKYEMAKIYYAKVLLRDTAEIWLMKDVSIMYYYLNDYDKAKQYILEMERIDSVTLPCVKLIGNAYTEEKQLSKGEYFYLKALKIDSTDNEACYNIACCYSRQNDIENALTYIEKSIKYGFNNYSDMNVDTDLENIRHTPGFKDLMKKYFPKQYKE